MSIPDVISKLPTDASQPSDEEMRVVEALFGRDDSPPGRKWGLIQGAKEALLLVALFILVSLPFVDSAISNLVTVNNTYARLAIKGLVLAFVFLVVRRTVCSSS